MSPALLDAHAALHASLEDALYHAMERLVALDVAAARARVDGFARVLAAHMAWEDERVIPAYRTVAPADGPGRADHVAGDHVILVRTLAALREAVDDLATVDDLVVRDVLRVLPAAYRVLSTLEHHTAREQSAVYPALLRIWDAADVDAAVSVLVEARSST